MTVINCEVKKGGQIQQNDRWIWRWPFTAEISENGKERVFECDFSEILKEINVELFSPENGTLILNSEEAIEKGVRIDMKKTVMYGHGVITIGFDIFLDGLLEFPAFVKAIKKIEGRQWLTKKFEERGD